MQYKQTLATSSKYKAKNTCEYIILHHTATGEGTIKGVLNHLTTSGKASCHYVVDTNGDVYKIGQDTDALWHVGESAWKGETNINMYSIGIEIIGPLADGGFTDAQRKVVAQLVQELAQKYAVPVENVLRHADLTHAWSLKGILWDGKSRSRKVDVAKTFYKDFATFEDYRNSLFTKPKKPMASKYTKVMQDAIKETWFVPLFSDHTGDQPLTEQETKELIEAWFARFWARIQPKK